VRAIILISVVCDWTHTRALNQVASQKYDLNNLKKLEAHEKDLHGQLALATKKRVSGGVPMAFATLVVVWLE